MSTDATTPSEQTDSAAGPQGDDSPLRWFSRGLAVGLLIVGSVNAVSYFFRSSSWGSLIGEPRMREESIGFPFKVWEAGNTYGGMFADYSMLGLNALFAVGLGSLIGTWAALQTKALNRWIGKMTPADEPRPIQFSLRGLLIATVVAAVIAMVARNFAARKETLLVIYALGPLSLVAVAMLPRHLSWHRRIMIIIPAAYALIAAAIAVGVKLGMEFDQVLMGIFLCWTPQSALAAFGLTVAILASQARREPRPATTPADSR